jgi:amino acid transporter
MSEEAANATKAVPYGIIMSIGSCWLFGFILVIVIAACMNPDPSIVLSSPFGQPMAQIYYEALGKNGALGMMSLLMIVQFLMGVSILVAASRQSWAFSRDGALPFSKFFRPISKTFGYIPVRTTLGCAFLAAVLGLLCLIAPAAAASSGDRRSSSPAHSIWARQASQSRGPRSFSSPSESSCACFQLVDRTRRRRT